MPDAAETVVPTACTLDASDAHDRVRRWRAVSTAAHPITSRPAPDTIHAAYDDSLGVVEELTSLAALEADCCPFLAFTVQAVDDTVHLTIRPAPGADTDVATSLETFASLITGTGTEAS